MEYSIIVFLQLLIFIDFDDNKNCIYIFLFGNINLGFEAPNALRHMRMYCTDQQNGKVDRIRVG